MKIAVLPGDGIGREVTAGALRCEGVLARARSRLTKPHRGRVRCRDSLPHAELARQSDAILHGASGVAEDEKRLPQQAAGFALLRLRKALNLFANLRPAFMFPELIGSSTLKPEVVEGSTC